MSLYVSGVVPEHCTMDVTISQNRIGDIVNKQSVTVYTKMRRNLDASFQAISFSKDNYLFQYRFDFFVRNNWTDVAFVPATITIRGDLPIDFHRVEMNLSIPLNPGQTASAIRLVNLTPGGTNDIYEGVTNNSSISCRGFTMPV
jgi:hypothetical protein